MGFWDGKRVLVTGGTGFIGSHCVERLLNLGAHVRVTTHNPSETAEYLSAVRPHIDLLELDLACMDDAEQAVAQQDILIHLAAYVAGVEYNSSHPVYMLQRNIEIGLPVMTAAAESSLERIVCVSSACVYTRHCSIPTPEHEGFLGDPEPTNFGYGWAKRLLEVHARGLHQQFDVGVTIVRPYNGYGPRDNFSDETSHVIPALIKRADQSVEVFPVWGDGQQTRSFLYVSDFVEGILVAAEQSANADPINIGSDEEVTIADLAQRIVNLVNPDLQLDFDLEKPRGQPRRRGDHTKAKALGFEPTVPLSEGLARTVHWFQEVRPN